MLTSSLHSTMLRMRRSMQATNTCGEPIDDAGPIGVIDAEHARDIAVEIDEQRWTGRGDRTCACDDGGSAAALGGVAERDHDSPKWDVPEAGRGLGRESVMAT